VDEVRRKNKEIQTSQDQTEQRQENLSEQVDRYQSVADQLGGVVSSSLKVPVITTMSFSKDVLNIHGYGFGPSQGRLFFKIFENERHQNLLNLTIEPHAVEVSGEQILSWSDNKVTCRQSKIPKAVGTPVMVQLMTSTGNKSYTFNLPSRR
jgi:hypothetical protein